MADPRPDTRILATARLVENLAALMPVVRRHAAEQIAYADGHRSETLGAALPTGIQPQQVLAGPCPANKPNPVAPDELITCNRPRPCSEHDSPVSLTSVEAAAESRLRIELWLDDVEARCKLIAVSAIDALQNGRRIVGTRLAQPVMTVCSDMQAGKMGSHIWGDPLCTKTSVRSGLCAAHYQAWYRHRRAAGVDVSHDHEPSG